VAIALTLSSIKFLKEYERLVIFRFGRLNGVRGPGPQIVWPFIETFKKIDVRETTLYIEISKLTTADLDSLKANGTCSMQITDPGKCITLVDDFREATKHAAANAVKEVLSKYKKDEITLTDARLKKAVRNAIERTTIKWGVRITDFSFEVEGLESKGVEVAPSRGRSSAQPRIEGPAIPESASVQATAEQPGRAASGNGHNRPLTHPHQDSHPHSNADAISHAHAHHSLLHSHQHGHYEFGAHAYEFGHKKKDDEAAPDNGSK
jgi:hypothetical protein